MVHVSIALSTHVGLWVLKIGIFIPDTERSIRLSHLGLLNPQLAVMRRAPSVEEQMVGDELHITKPMKFKVSVSFMQNCFY